MSVTQCLTNGGVPRDWTVENLQWLAQAHRHHAAAQIATRSDRSYWHRRWAALIEDVLEARLAHHH